MNADRASFCEIFESPGKMLAKTPGLRVNYSMQSRKIAKMSKKPIRLKSLILINNLINARVAELADALDLGSSGIPVGVRVPSLAPRFKPWSWFQYTISS